jgi:hypothetical protein
MSDKVVKIRHTGTHRTGPNTVYKEAQLRARALSVRYYLRDYRPKPMPKRPFPYCCKEGS